MKVGLILQRSIELTEVQRPKGLGRWMQLNFDALEEGFKLQQSRPNWYAFAVALAEAGIVAPDGSPFKPATARRAWARTVEAVAKRRARKVEPPARPAPQVRPVLQQAKAEPAIPEPYSVSDEPEPDLSKMFPLLSRPKRTGA